MDRRLVEQGVVQGTPQGVVQGTPQGVVQGTPQGVVQGTPQGVVRGTPQGVVRGTPQGVVRGTPRSAPPTSAIVARGAGGRVARKGVARPQAAIAALSIGAWGRRTVAEPVWRDTGSAPTEGRTLQPAFAGKARREPCCPITAGTPVTGRNWRS